MEVNARKVMNLISIPIKIIEDFLGYGLLDSKVEKKLKFIMKYAFMQ